MNKILFYILLFKLISLTNPDQVNTQPKQPSVKTAIVMNKEEKEYALFKHNQARSRSNPSASNMLKMIWDEDLEKDAVEYSRQCIYEHDPDRSIDKHFRHVGENLYIGFPIRTSKDFLKISIEFWDNEKYNYSYDTNECNLLCGHYTQMLWDDTYAVGCGISVCYNIDGGDRVLDEGQLVVCRYGPGGNVNNRRPYVLGTYCTVCPRDYWCEENLCTNSAPNLVPKFLLMGLLIFLIMPFLFLV